MAVHEIRIPQMGEGLREVLVVELLKKPGDPVQRDEPIYSMETDKAAMEVESPHEGVLAEWLVKEGDVLEIGALIARIETTDGETATEGSPARETAAPASAPVIPPRTRAYGREKGLSDAELRQIPAASGKLMPADIDTWLGTPATAPEGTGSAEYTDRKLSPQQRTFLYRLRRSANVVPAVAKRTMPWSSVPAAAEAFAARGGGLEPTSFQTFAFCAARALREHPRFRSIFVGEDTVREYEHANLGIAVGTTEGYLSTAVVHSADSLDYTTFVTDLQASIAECRAGVDQADESTQFYLTYMHPSYEIIDAIPVLVAPAAAILFVGAPFEQAGVPTVNLVLVFDHRLIQGLEAAEFLKTLVETVARIEELTQNG